MNNLADIPARTVTHTTSMSLRTTQQRAVMLSKIRQFFAQREVLEVQTPILSQAGNTDIFIESVTARVKIQDKGRTYYLHTSPEFAMKRLLASYQTPIYQICPVFRNNELGRRHNIEFTMLEWYRPDYSLNQLANELSDLLSEIMGRPQIFRQYRYIDAFLDHVGVHPLQASCQVLSAVAVDKGIAGVENLDLEDDHQGLLDLLFSHCVEPKLGHDMPTLIVDYPAATASLAKVETDKDDNVVAKRFELYINGVEIANAYDELADGEALRKRFIQDNAERRQRGLPTIPIDENLLTACDNMPESSGIALGIDRLLMMLVNATHIDKVISFTADRA